MPNESYSAPTRANLKQTVSGHGPVLAWIPQFAGDVIHKGRRHRKDGKTSYEKENGKRWLKPMYEFAEILFIKQAQERAGRPKRDWQPRMVEARFVGHHSRTQSIIGLTPDGVVYGQCAKRLPREERWPIAGWD